MKPLKLSEFPVLRQVFGGYLHEDFPEEYGTPTAALRAFHNDADPAERRRFAREAKRFVERTAPLDFADVRALVTRLGSSWSPPSREALIAALMVSAEK